MIISVLQHRSNKILVFCWTYVEQIFDNFAQVNAFNIDHCYQILSKSEDTSKIQSEDKWSLIIIKLQIKYNF